MAVLVAVLATYYQGGPGSIPTEGGVGSAISFCLLTAAGFTIVRVTGSHDKLVGNLRNCERMQLSLASIVQSCEDAIIGENPDGVITSWNEAATRLFGYSADEMIGSNITAISPEGRAGDAFERAQRVQRGERVRHYETVRRRKDGLNILVDLSISPIRDAAGHIVGASNIARDVSDRRRMQDQLVYSQKVESLGVLAGGIAHDFNNLLMSIIANATLIQDEVPAGSVPANLAQHVLLATEQASHLTRQMLHYSGKGRYQVEPLSLTKQIEDIVLLFRSTIPKDVELRLELDPNLPPINADVG